MRSSDLKKFYSEKTGERGGYILNGQIVECKNEHPNPADGFCMGLSDLEKAYEAEATWHTHPNGSKNLSRDDYYAFQNLPDKKHYIVGKDGVFCYTVDEITGGLIVLEENSCV